MFPSAFAPGGSLQATQVFFDTFGQSVIGPIIRKSPYNDPLTPPDQEPPGPAPAPAPSPAPAPAPSPAPAPAPAPGP